MVLGVPILEHCRVYLLEKFLKKPHAICCHLENFEDIYFGILFFLDLKDDSLI